MTKLADKKQIVVIGDTHSRLDLAFEGLNELEREYGAIDQVFSVGDAGLFLCADDWTYLAGPKKYRHPEQSHQITAAWEKWRWPMAMIGGNHEPYHRLRMFDPVHFGPKLSYTDAGILKHQIPDLRMDSAESSMRHTCGLELLNIRDIRLLADGRIWLLSL